MSLQNQVENDKSQIEILKKSQITIDPEIQARVGLDQNTVAEYSKLRSQGVYLGPVKVVSDDITYWLYDGFHRCDDPNLTNDMEIEVEIKLGTREDAIWLALGENKHGLKRTNADKVKAIKRALETHNSKSDRQIADHIGVDRMSVRKYREELEKLGTISMKENTTGKDGKKYPKKTKKTKQGENFSPCDNKDIQNEKENEPLLPPQTKQGENFSPCDKTPITKEEVETYLSSIPDEEKKSFMEKLQGKPSKQDRFNFILEEINNLGISLLPNNRESPEACLRRIIDNSSELEYLEERARKTRAKTLKNLIQLGEEIPYD